MQLNAKQTAIFYGTKKEHSATVIISRKDYGHNISKPSEFSNLDRAEDEPKSSQVQKHQSPANVV